MDIVRRTGLAALIATHNYDLAQQMDRILALEEGLVVERPRR
jgi:lipoprotein-releasing system ATP-binding protein